MYFTPQTVIINKLVLNENISLDASKKTLDVAYGIDKNFIFGCGISIASILLNNKKTNFTFHVFTDFFDKKNREEFTKLSHQYNTQMALLNKSELADRIAPVGTPVMRFGRYAAYPTASSGSAL